MEIKDLLYFPFILTGIENLLEFCMIDQQSPNLLIFIEAWYPILVFL